MAPSVRPVASLLLLGLLLKFVDGVAELLDFLRQLSLLFLFARLQLDVGALDVVLFLAAMVNVSRQLERLGTLDVQEGPKDAVP